MGKGDKKIREDEMWCPECGAPIKKGFFTCSNCRLKVRMTLDINREQDNKKVPGPKKENTGEEAAAAAGEPEKSNNDAVLKNPLNKSGHPRYWSF